MFKREWGTIHGNTNDDKRNTKAKADQQAYTIHLTAIADNTNETKINQPKRQNSYMIYTSTWPNLTAIIV